LPDDGSPYDVIGLLDSAEDIIRTSKKHRRSLDGRDYYSQKFAEKGGDWLILLENLRKRLAEKDSIPANSALEQMARDLEVYFKTNTPDSERARINKQVRLIHKTKISPLLDNTPFHAPSNDLFPLELVANTRGYLETIAKQACGCYDLGWYDASAVMIRRLLETLIIECFEAHQISARIKNGDGYFFYLEELISRFLSEDSSSWNISRNTKRALPNLKKIGDQSAHSRHFTAKKPDIDKLKDDLRVTLEELTHISKLK
jgi:hypothetical protein